MKKYYVVGIHVPLKFYDIVYLHASQSDVNCLTSLFKTIMIIIVLTQQLFFVAVSLIKSQLYLFFIIIHKTTFMTLHYIDPHLSFSCLYEKTHL